jgi:hypothetical protein
VVRAAVWLGSGNRRIAIGGDRLGGDSRLPGRRLLDILAFAPIAIPEPLWIALLWL